MYSRLSFSSTSYNRTSKRNLSRKNICNEKGKYQNLNSNNVVQKASSSFQNTIGSGSTDNLQQAVSSRIHNSKPNRNNTEFIRKYPIGIKILESLLEKDPYIIPVELLKYNSGYDLLLKDNELKDYKILIIIKLMEKSLLSKANEEGAIDLLLATFSNANFCQKLMSFVSLMKYKLSKAKEFLPLITSIISKFFTLSPSNAYSLISNLVDVCFGVIMHIKNEDPSLVTGLEQAFENIQLQIKESLSSIRTKKVSNIIDSAPQDDFRKQEVIPTSNELNALETPFLRKNIIEGHFENSDHYLDIQFRLLKEDFIRPLREGLRTYRKSNTKRNSDVRIYRHVTVDSSAVERDEYVYYLKLTFRRGFNIEYFKNLMYGNILCISSDNFETMMIATVVNRDKLKDHLIAVKLETEPFKLVDKLMYTLIESRAYFVSYKHTLTALQGIEEVPMKDYIVHVKESKSPPDYISFSTVYKFKFGSSPSVDVNLLSPIEDWTSFGIGMDMSQRRALHGALTRKLAVIQGPPGTGKTFLGLQLTNILLHNKSKWNKISYVQESRPILVVCYTNHALDQFLEGILSFTKNIIRVGSQSKSEILRQYQINKLKFIPNMNIEDNHISLRYSNLRNEISAVHQEIDKIIEILKSLNEIGIISPMSFSKEFPMIIPYHLLIEIKRSSMEYFLIGNWDSDTLENISRRTERKFLYDDFIYQDNVEEEIEVINRLVNNEGLTNAETNCEFGVLEEVENWVNSKDAFNNGDIHFLDGDMSKEEEQERMLDDVDEEPIPEEEIQKVHVPYFEFEVTHKEIVTSIKEAQSFIDVNPFNWNNRYQIKMIKYRKLELRSIKICQRMNCNAVECEKLGYLYAEDLSFIQRWKLYKYWCTQLEKKYKERLSTLENMHIKLSKSLASLKDLKYLRIMKGADVVGMTTTGAAQYCKLLHDLAPPIVIVEEAAEIMEAHLVTSLSNECKHLIVIGDHQQLRPKPNVYELGVKYHLNTSFFERMVKNGITYETLEYQHRMKPVISNLLVPTIYEDLKDHPSVFKYPKVKGIKKDLFFIDHTVFESPAVEDMETFENVHEAKFLMGLCRHLLYQGYETEDITIISPYLGQLRCLKKLQKQHEFNACVGVRISVLDNYQGEESNIILLSLVRSNEEKKVGFLKIDNRVCVALSRAKHGMYIIGNMSQMTEASELWKKINNKLVDKGNIGPELELECPNHPEQVMKVASLSDILLKSPEGGCKIPCSSALPKCEHKCPRLCHASGQDHTNVKCLLPCHKTLCDVGHLCHKRCHEECGRCDVLIKKLLPCEHEHLVKCSIKPKDFKCPTIITKELPHCKHKQEMECHTDVLSYICKENCIVRPDCGHQCKRKCHALKDPNHESYNCHSPCDKSPQNCEFDHKCKKKCYELCEPCDYIINRLMKCGHTLKNIKCGILEKDIKCPCMCKNMLPCGHKCKKICSAPCGGCFEIMDKIIPECNHSAKVPCSKSPTVKYCNGKCQKLLPCQHHCRKKCKESCTTECRQLVGSDYRCPKVHKVKLPCYLTNTSGNTLSKNSTALEGKTVGEYCTEICGTTLDCKHLCKGKCGECFNGRLHTTCKEKCNKILVCGHVCKEPCSIVCPPCQSKCLWKCSHSQCRKTCGLICINCREQCNRKCPHARCTAKCGNPCTSEPCSMPCPTKLKCGHDCIGYCGEPCPRQCRICDKNEVTEIFFGTEDEEDARFVLLEDCGHIFEAKSLNEWMNGSSGEGNLEIGMKLCPRCKNPIYITQRYKNVILKMYSNVWKVKRKHFTTKGELTKLQIKKILKGLQNVYVNEIETLRENLGFNRNFDPKHKQRKISDQQHILYEFQLNFLNSAKPTRDKLGGKNSKLLKLIEKLMKYNLSISQQTMDEFSCELRRIEICSSVEKVRSHLQPNCFSPLLPSAVSLLNNLVAKIDTIMDPTIKFNQELEKKVKDCLKEAERCTGSLGITKRERLQILKAMGLTQGHWYACPNGHVYCITECGGATVESVCPDCKARIGGRSHRLRSDNRVATEMDGAKRSAWPGGR